MESLILDDEVLNPFAGDYNMIYHNGRQFNNMQCPADTSMKFRLKIKNITPEKSGIIVTVEGRVLAYSLPRLCILGL